MRTPVLALAMSAAALSGCSTAMEAVRGPELSPVGLPAQLVAQTQTYAPTQEEREIARERRATSANSLWRTGARAFFADQRAARVGDILTVNIDINDRASLTNATSRSRTSGLAAGIPNFLGLESSLGRILPGGFDPANAVRTNSTQSTDGSGTVDRAERLNLTIAAVVTGVLPNGNLVIQGRQEVRTNQELRELTVAGVVRPEDIAANNTIRHTQIAEARISYGGRGSLTRMNNVPAGQSLVETFTPF
jgi:flagellar L-ring protein precursor FlgH